MTQEVEEGIASIQENSEDPIEDGEMADVVGQVPLDYCDSNAAWSVISGNGVTIETCTDPECVVEGNGSIKVTVPANIQATIKSSFGAANLIGMKKIRMYANACNKNQTFQAYVSNNANAWNQIYIDSSTMFSNKTWTNLKYANIANVANANKNAVVSFALVIPSNANNVAYYFDFLRAEQYHALKVIVDGQNRTLFPKAIGGIYEGSGGEQTIQTYSNGTPYYIQIMADGKKPYYWTSGMPKVGNNYNSLTPDAANNAILVFTANAITGVGDGYFMVSGAASTNGTEYYWIAFFSG